MSAIAVFLDRDGTINEDPGYFHDPDQLRLYPGAADGIAQLNRAGLLVILVPNQGGIALGYYAEHQFLRVQERMAEELQRAGAHLDAIYFCPHHPDGVVESYRRVCSCRKPAPGMLLKAAAELSIDLARSYMIGDKESDIQAGVTAGCRTILVNAAGCTGSGTVLPDRVVPDLNTAVQWLLADLDARL